MSDPFTRLMDDLRRYDVAKAVPYWKSRLASFPRVVLPAGTRLYHGTLVEEEFEFPEPYGWFSLSPHVASKYATEIEGVTGGTGDRDRLLVYRTKRDLPLVAIDDATMWEDAYAGGVMIAHTLCRMGEYGYYIFNGDEIMLCYPQHWLTPGY